MNLIPDLRRMVGLVDPLPDTDDAAAAYIAGKPDNDAELNRRVRRPIVAGSIVVGLMFVVLLLWAFLSISGAILAPGSVRIENNSKEIRRLEGGTVRKIFVQEGQRVKKDQLLIQFDETQNQATVDVYQSNVDSARANIARFSAEAANRADIQFPPELTTRANDLRIATLMSTQRAVFQTRTLLYRSQANVLQSQADQLKTQISGMQIQADSITDQGKLVQEELSGVRELSRQGYAPNSRLLALERSAVQVKGQRGAIAAEMARARQSIGEISLQIAQLQDRHQTEVADGIRQAQDLLAENEPKLRALQEQLSQTVIRSPVPGYVFNLSQFTEGGVATPGQLLMQIVPTNAKLVVLSEIQPKDIADVRLGMLARVTLTAFSTRTTPPVEGHVTRISPDARVNDKTGQTYFIVEVTITPGELAAAGPEVKLTPGMQANVAIVTGDRSILTYLFKPFMASMHDAMREK